MNRRLSTRTLPLLSFLVAACAHEAPAPMSVPATPPAAQPAPAPAPAPAKESTFENPGGMWMPEQLADQTATLKSLGLEVDPAALTDPSSDLLQSIVSLGGCSASFVSPDGLIATNHHCAVGALQLNSTPKDNLLHDGYLAKTRADERSNGPAARVFVTRAFKNVTREMRDGLEKLPNDQARKLKVEEREKAMVAACEKGRPGTRCTVASYSDGTQFRLIEQLEIRDVRLVFAPPMSVGNFGGEIDNWRWPRHTGDVSLFRAYVGKDGKPADFSADNVPFASQHHLKLASKPLKAGDLVMIAGYPAQTNRVRTAAETREAIEWYYPRELQYREEAIAALEAAGKNNQEIALKANPALRGLNNYLTKDRGILEGLTKGGIAAEKAKHEEELAAWVAGDASRKAAYGDVLDKIAMLAKEREKTRDADAALDDVYRTPLLASASRIVRMAEERPKPDAQRRIEFQERRWAEMEQQERTAQKRFDPAIDKALLKLALVRASQMKERPAFLALIVGAGEPTEAKIDQAIDALYKSTKMSDVDARVALLKTAKTDDLKKSKDPIVQLAVKLRPQQKAVIDRRESYEGAMLMLRPRYAEMVEKWTQKPLALDANRTLRITYGTVRGYRPTPTAPAYKPFTVASEVVQKSSGKEPFDTPAPVLDALKAKKVGPYADSDLGELPVDFLSDLDISNGNSGSATLNARGELVGLAFDGNYESMASDWVFQPSITRTIHVDARYVLWLLDGVYGGDQLVKEMGGTPAL